MPKYETETLFFFNLWNSLLTGEKKIIVDAYPICSFPIQVENIKDKEQFDYFQVYQ